MKIINTLIREGMQENEKELNEDLKNLKSVKDIMKQNKNFDFDVSIFYNVQTTLLELKYTFKKEKQQISVRFHMSDTCFSCHDIEISRTLIDYAISYFNKTDFKTNIGSYDGDYYVGIKDFIESFYDENGKSHLWITDDVSENTIL